MFETAEADEIYWGAAESGGANRPSLVYGKALIYCRMARMPDFDRTTLHDFIRSSYRETEGYSTTGRSTPPRSVLEAGAPIRVM
ncbi:MAG: hypothetical protein WCA06_01840 [Terrimicrobiaceae bacterium]